jgi:hypothetical protein
MELEARSQHGTEVILEERVSTINCASVEDPFEI